MEFTPVTEQLYFGANSRNDAHGYPLYYRNTGNPWSQTSNAGLGYNDAVYGRFNASTLVGINEAMIKENTIFLYPNPANNFVEIVTDGIRGQYADLIIYNSSGQVIDIKAKEYSANGKIKININDLSGGLYLFKLILKDGETINKKFIIQR